MGRRSIDPAWGRADWSPPVGEAGEQGEKGSVHAAPQVPTFDLALTHVSGRRYAAHVLDGIVYWLLAIVPLGAAAVISHAALAILFVFLLVPGPVVYFVLTQRRSGRSPGKHAVGIRVVDAAGQVPSQTALVKRSIPLIVEYVYILAWISMMSSESRQRFGDRWARTYVIGDQVKKLEEASEELDLECGICGERFDSETAARGHVSQLHPDAPGDPEASLVRR